MSEIDKAIARVRDFFRTRPTMKRTIARKAAVHRNSLNGIELKSWNPRAETLRRLIAAIESEESKEEARARRKVRPKLAA
jgi:hypothetical protein